MCSLFCLNEGALGLTLLSISVYIGPSPRERKKKRKMIDERKKCPNNPNPHLLQAQQALALLIQISRTPRHWKFTQHHRTTRPPPAYNGMFGHVPLPIWVIGWCECAGQTSRASYNFDSSRARAYCACSWCGLGLFLD